MNKEMRKCNSEIEQLFDQGLLSHYYRNEKYCKNNLYTKLYTLNELISINNQFENLNKKFYFIISIDFMGGLYVVFKRNEDTKYSLKNEILYFAPDTLEFEGLGMSYDDFIDWLETGDVTEFYGDYLFQDYENVLKNRGVDESVAFYPFPWTAEFDVNTAEKAYISSIELAKFNFSMR